MTRERYSAPLSAAAPHSVHCYHIRQELTVWHFRRPSAARIREFLAGQRQAPFSYPEVGATRNATPGGYNNDHNRILLGKGLAVFEAGRAAIMQWQMFPGTWAVIEPAN